MDLTLFIILIVIAVMMYYLITSIQSLIKEIGEVKAKCIRTNNAKTEDFVVETADPAKLFTSKLLSTLENIKSIFQDKQ